MHKEIERLKKIKKQAWKNSFNLGKYIVYGNWISTIFRGVNYMCQLVAVPMPVQSADPSGQP